MLPIKDTEFHYTADQGTSELRNLVNYPNFGFLSTRTSLFS